MPEPGLPLSFLSLEYVRQGSIFGRMVRREYQIFGVLPRQCHPIFGIILKGLLETTKM